MTPATVADVTHQRYWDEDDNCKFCGLDDRYWELSPKCVASGAPESAWYVWKLMKTINKIVDGIIG
jgi:hypothetical protein